MHIVVVGGCNIISTSRTNKFDSNSSMMLCCCGVVMVFGLAVLFALLLPLLLLDDDCVDVNLFSSLVTAWSKNFTALM